MESDSSEANVVYSRENVINALLEFFIDPLLLPKTPTRGRPALAEKDMQIAKQMHAVVMLYMYYHLKQYPESEYLGFEDFCKMVVALRPSLKVHMKFTNSNSSSDDNGKSVDCLSKTENAIHDAMNISLVLDPSKDNPNIETWPISKVAVLVVDVVTQKCIVVNSPVTKFVCFSVIEKDADGERKGRWKNVYKKKGSKSKVTDDVDVDRFQQLAFAAVKEATGITEANLKVLESHLVYSLSKEKCCTRFYIVQCTELYDVIRFSLQDMIDGMRGPVVKESSGKLTATSVVKHYHMLPYAAVISDWLSRQEIQSKNKELASEEEDKVIESKPVSTNASQMADTEDPNHEYDGESERTLTEKYSDHQKRKSCSAEKDINARATSVEAAESNVKQTLHDSKDNIDVKKLPKTASEAPIKERKDLAAESKMKQTIHESDVKKLPKTASEALIKKRKDLAADSKMKQTLHESKHKSNEEKLPKNASEALIKKRKELAELLASLEDEKAVYDQTIKKISNGGESGTALALQVVIDQCKEGQGRNEPNTSCNANLSSETSCQELDEIAKENNWPMPDYVVRVSNGMFSAKVKLKGSNIKLSAAGNMKALPNDARASAAEKLLSKLRHIKV